MLSSNASPLLFYSSIDAQHLTKVDILNATVVIIVVNIVINTARHIKTASRHQGASKKRRSRISQSFLSYDMWQNVWVVFNWCIFHTLAIQYTHDWAIEVQGGHAEADLVAKDTGCVNQGKTNSF